LRSHGELTHPPEDRRGDRFEELYDLVADPFELDNKAKDPSYASDAAMLRSLDDRLKSCAGASCWYLENREIRLLVFGPPRNT
jgi:hypothetical protein